MDRNLDIDYCKTREHRSLSARRAWIEIRIYDMSAAWNRVALRKESVDRNNISTNYHIRVREVALRKESVDRNTNFHSASLFNLRRSPQGERG